MNVGNLLKVRAVILEEPKRVDMGDFIITGTKEWLVGRGYAAPECETVGCIAGWGAVLFRLERTPGLKTFKKAAHSGSVFGVPVDACEFFGFDGYSGDELYYEDNWPKDLRNALYEKSAGTADYAQVVATAIDRFIACDGNWNNDASEAAG